MVKTKPTQLMKRKSHTCKQKKRETIDVQSKTEEF